jgi:hypothetical protein
MAKKAKAPSISDQIAAMQNTITTDSSMSAGETQADQSLANLTSSSALGQSDAMDPVKNAVSMNFQTGQAAAIQSQANAQAVPLEQQLQILQQQRADKMQGDVTNLGSLENTYNTEQQAQLQEDLEKSKEKAAAKLQASQGKIDSSAAALLAQANTGIQNLQDSSAANVAAIYAGGGMPGASGGSNVSQYIMGPNGVPVLNPNYHG